MKYARVGFDIGLFSNTRDEQLDFWQQVVGLPYDHMGKLGGGMQQHRHHLHGAILKMNHARQPLPTAPASGYRELVVAQPGRTTLASLSDPDGNRVVLVPPGHDGIATVALVQETADMAAMTRFYRDGLGLEEVAPGRFRTGEALIVLRSGAAPERCDDWRAPGYRYITFQVDDARTGFAEALANGAETGAPLRDMGDLVRFGFIRDPDGNWIEISERTTFTGHPLAL